MALIELENVTYHYPFCKTPALRDISFSFEEGVFYGVIGENGGGKTSLCNLLRGLIPHFYRGELEGRVTIDGTDVRAWDTGRLSARIGYVFQNPFTQISGIKATVFEEVAMGLENLGCPKREMVDRVLQICKLLGIEHLMEKNPNELSGGQRQRVAFASILAMDAGILVIDEPTSQLDPQGTQDVFEIIHGLRGSGKTILLVEHKIDLIAEYCDRVLVMQEGRIVRSGPTAEVLAAPDLEDVGAMPPQVAAFGHAMAAAGKPLAEIPITLADAERLVRRRQKEVHG